MQSLLRWGALAAVLAGCGGGSTPGSGGAAGARTLTVATTDDIKSLDPALAYDTWSTAVVHAATRRLVDYDAAGKVVPDLAESWGVTDGDRTYRFHLRAAKFGDGAPVEARHFKTALDRVREPKTASPGAAFYSGISAVDAPDPRTLVLKLKAPDPTLLNLLGMTFIAPQREGTDPASAAAGSGPYYIQAYEPGVRVVLRRNPHAGSGANGVEEIVLQLRVNTALQLTRFRSGEIDLLPAIPPAELERVLSDPQQKDNFVQGVVNQTWYFGMNTSRPPWNQAKVRQAALLAISRDRHAQLAGAGQAANGILPPHLPGYDPNRKLPAQDLEAAKRLVAEAFPGGAPRTTLWLVQNDEHPRHAESIQSDLAAAGIPIDLRPVLFSEYLSGYRTRADCWYGGRYPDFPDAGNFLEPVLRGGAGSNAARYNNPKVNALLDRAHSAPRGSGREQLYRDAETLILRDAPWAPLYFEVETRYFRDGITGVTVHPVWRQMLTGIGK